MDESVWTHKELMALTDHLLVSQEDLRFALAREMHHELGALLTGLSLDLSRLQTPELSSSTDRDAVLESGRALLRQAVVLKRSFIEHLYPSTLLLLGLGSALENLTRETGERYGFEATATIPDTESAIGGPMAIDLYRLAQAALDNVAGHAQATAVHVELALIDGRLILSVRDNGIGFIPAMGKVTPGFRLMRYRVDRWNGELQIESAPGNGTTVSASVPWPASR